MAVHWRSEEREPGRWQDSRSTVTHDATQVKPMSRLITTVGPEGLESSSYRWLARY
ncbi:hypothetical protein CITRIK5_30047 [Citricoccus sp. K5]|nr:hypothetical protein CITRIK5_30047 [Citricoccus sp. K5]